MKALLEDTLLFIQLQLYKSIHLSIYLYVCMFVCLSGRQKKRKLYQFFTASYSYFGYSLIDTVFGNK